jgi:hypothetical protein
MSGKGKRSVETHESSTVKGTRSNSSYGVGYGNMSRRGMFFPTIQKQNEKTL